MSHTQETELTRYSAWAPTGFDPKGAFLDDDRGNWFVVPVMQTRDSGPLDQSNFAAALEILGGEDSENGVEVHRFGHWGPGWFEIILVDPKHEQTVRDIVAALENYPVLNDDDFSQREYDDFSESWDSWGSREYAEAIADVFELRETAKEFLIDNRDQLKEFYMDTANEPYYGESEGVCIPARRNAERLERPQVAQLIRQLRNAR